MSHQEPECVETRDADGTILRTWVLGDDFHRIDGPAVEEWFANGQLKNQEWWMNGQRHRTDGPAAQAWYHNGQLESQEWWVDGKRHRTDGPAWVSNDDAGTRMFDSWWVNGLGVDESPARAEAINPETSPERLTELACGKDAGLAALAVANPNCPEDARVMNALTHRPHSAITLMSPTGTGKSYSILALVKELADCSVPETAVNDADDDKT